MDAPSKGKPPLEAFKCSGSEFTSHPRWEHVGISYMLSLKFPRDIFPPHETDQKHHQHPTKNPKLLNQKIKSW